MYFRKTWIDPRLKKKESSVESMSFKAEHMLSKIWTPDLFYPNAMAPSQIIDKGFVRINYVTGEVLFSQMSKEVFACSGVSASFAILNPNATIQCSIEIESYAFTNTDINIKPKDKGIAIDEKMMTQELLEVKNATTATRLIKLSTGTYERVSFVVNFESYLSRLPPMVAMKMMEHYKH